MYIFNEGEQFKRSLYKNQIRISTPNQLLEILFSMSSLNYFVSDFSKIKHFGEKSAYDSEKSYFLSISTGQKDRESTTTAFSKWRPRGLI